MAERVPENALCVECTWPISHYAQGADQQPPVMSARGPLHGHCAKPTDQVAGAPAATAPTFGGAAADSGAEIGRLKAVLLEIGKAAYQDAARASSATLQKIVDLAHAGLKGGK